MTETNTSPENKLASSQEHARKAVEATKKAAQATIEAGKQHLGSALNESKSHLSAAASDLGEAANAKYGEIRSQVENTAQDYTGRAKQALNEATIRARGFQDDGEQYIRENPLQAVGIALGVGFILGLIFRR